MNLTSKEILIQAKDETVYELLSNCNNFKQYIPEIQNWQSTENTCRFTIQGVGNVEMFIAEKKAFSTVIFELKNQQISSIIIHFDIKNQNEHSQLIAHSSIEIPFFVAQMIKSSVQKFLDLLVERIQQSIETKHMNQTGS